MDPQQAAAYAAYAQQQAQARGMFPPPGMPYGMPPPNPAALAAHAQMQAYHQHQQYAAQHAYYAQQQAAAAAGVQHQLPPAPAGPPPSAPAMPPPAAAPPPAAMPPPAPQTATEVAASNCEECRGKEGSHRKGCSLAGSVLDRRRQQAREALKKKQAEEEEAAAAAAEGQHTRAEEEEEDEDGVQDPVTGIFSKRIPQVCNSAYNINPVLQVNIENSDYYKSLYEIATTFEAILDEVYERCTYSTPFMPGTRNPSSVFCLLYKCFILKLTYDQLDRLLNHPDSPFIQCVGVLYVRYVVAPGEMWGFLAPKVQDKTEFDYNMSGRKITMGDWTRGLIENIHYNDTILPRIPVLIQRQMSENILKLEFRQKQLEDMRHKLRPGMKVMAAFYEDQQEYEAEIIKESKTLDGFLLTFPEYGNTQDTELADIRFIDEDGAGGDGAEGGKRKAGEVDFQEEVLKRQREGAAAKGGDYARRPTSYKSSLSSVLTTTSTRRESRH